MPNVALHQARNVIFGLVLVLSFAVLGISAHWITVTAGTFFTFEGIGIAAGALSIIILSTLLLVGILRKNATITIIGVELPTLIVLSALFLAEGIITKDLGAVSFPFGCDRRAFEFPDVGVPLCKEFMALKSISLAIFAIMAAYWLPLAVLTLFGLTQGRNILGQSIREVQFSAGSNTFTPVMTGDSGIKAYDLHQQEQLQLQQLQLQQLQQQQLMLQQQQQQQQQQYMMPQQPQV